jgi:hypothetical protein
MKKLQISFAALVSVCMLTANASAYQWFNLQPSGTGAWDWQYETEIDFAQTSDGIGASGGKFLQINGQDVSVNGHCLEIVTGARNSANPDTRIWVFDGSNWRSVNDDFGGARTSKARFWLATGGGVGLDYLVKVEAFNSAYNSMDFYHNVYRRDLTEAACTTSQTTIPWAKMKTASGTTNWGTVTLSPNAT